MRPMKTLLAAAALICGAGMAQANCSVPAGANGYANELIRGVNASRAQMGLSQLDFNRRLSRAAMTHACDMQRNGFFAHQGSDGSNSHERVKRVGYRTCLTAENLAHGYPQAMTVVNGWLNSPGHRRNMLQPDVQEMGVAITQGPHGPIAVLVVSKPC